MTESGSPHRTRFVRLPSFVTARPGSVVIALDLALLTLVAFIFYLPTFRLLVAEWFKPGITFYSHGPMVVFISLLLIRYRHRVMAKPVFCIWGVLPLLGTLALFAAGAQWDQPYITLLSFVTLILGIVWLSFGNTTTRALLFPILFLVLAVPLPVVYWAAISLTRPLGQLVEGLLQMARIDAVYHPAWTELGAELVPTSVLQVRDSNYLVVPLCTGINFVLALLTLLLPLLYLTRAGWRRITLFVIAAPVIALSLKVLLLAVTVGITPSLGIEKAEELYHGWLGVPTFLLGFIILLVPMLLTRAKTPRPHEPAN